MINFTVNELLLAVGALFYIIGVLFGSAAKGYRFARFIVSIPFLSFIVFETALFIQDGCFKYAMISGALAIIEAMIMSYRFGVTKRKRVLIVDDDLLND